MFRHWAGCSRLPDLPPAAASHAKVAAIAAAYGATPASVRYAPRTGSGIAGAAAAAVAGGRLLFNTSPRNRRPFTATRLASVANGDAASHRFGSASAPPRFNGLETPMKAARTGVTISLLKHSPKHSALSGSVTMPATPLPVGPGSMVPIAFENELAIAMQKRNKKKSSVRVTQFAVVDDVSSSTETQPQPAAIKKKKSARFADDGNGGGDDAAAVAAAPTVKPVEKKKMSARFADDS